MGIIEAGRHGKPRKEAAREGKKSLHVRDNSKKSRDPLRQVLIEPLIMK